MIPSKFFVLGLLAALPWYTSSMSMPECLKDGKKYCDYGKEISAALKDFSLQTNNFFTSLGHVLTESEVLQLATTAMSIAGYITVGFGLTAFVLDKQQKDQVKAAVEKLSKKMELLSIDIVDSSRKVIAHQDLKQFQEHVTLPVQTLQKRFDDFSESRLEEDQINLRKECKKNMPLSIIDKMEKMFVDNSDNSLLNLRYTDKAFEEYQRLYQNALLQLFLVYPVCDHLVHAKYPPSADEATIKQNRVIKIQKRINSLHKVFRDVNSTREEKVWNNIIPTELDRLYNEYGQLDFKERKKKEFAEAVAHRLNSDYRHFKRHFNFGVFKNRGTRFLKKKNKYSFECEKDVCQKKIADDFIVWILRSKECKSGKEHHSSPSACLHFQAELYNLYDTESLVYENATSVLKRFMKNCKIENAIAIFSYKNRLRGDSAGKAPVYNQNLDGKLFKILTEKPHTQYALQKNFFKNAVFWAECPKNDEPFDFYKEYCKTGNKWPLCELTEAAFNYHQLNDIPEIELWPPEMNPYVQKSLKPNTEQPEGSTEESEQNIEESEESTEQPEQYIEQPEIYKYEKVLTLQFSMMFTN